MKIPEAIVNAINGMLAPYGEVFVPGAGRNIGAGYLSVSSAAQYLGVSRCTVWRMIRDGKLHITEGLTRRISLDELEQALHAKGEKVC